MVQAPAGMEIIGAMRTDTGLVRSHNEDAVAWVTSHDDAAATNRGSLALVADGMGGHAAGEVASALAAANRAIIEYAQEHPECRGMGTTCTVLAFRDQQVWLAHIGDSRAYLLRDRHLTQLSEDQTLVAKLVSEGTITQAEADQSPMHNVILQALGTTANIKPMIGAKGLPLQSGDVLILCSAGVSNMVPDGKIAEVASRLPPQEACDALIEAALAAGGHDNASLGVFSVTAGAAPKRVEPTTRRIKLPIGANQNPSASP